MKSAHRHELETNVLAQRLEAAIERFRPYASTAAGIIIAIILVMFLWSYFRGTSAARREAAWDAYHRGVAAVPPDLDQLRRSAEEYPGTAMQDLANLTWADGQVWMAAREYIHNREAAMEALRRATSAYQSVLQTTSEERLVNRAHLGLARVYEMQNDLERAREEYLKVKGGYEEYAKLQAERLAEPETKDAYAWLAQAEAPRPRAPLGPGTPGEQPEFSASDLALPGAATDAAAPEAAPAQMDSFEELLQGMDLGFPMSEPADGEAADRGETGEPAPPTAESSEMTGEAPESAGETNGNTPEAAGNTEATDAPEATSPTGTDGTSPVTESSDPTPPEDKPAE